MTHRLILNMSMILALLAVPSKAEQPALDWSAVYQRARLGSITESKKVLEEGINAARERGEASAALAGALNDLGSMYHDSGHFAEADSAYRESLSIWRRLPEKNPKMGTVLGNLAGLRLAQARPSEAEKLYREAERLVTSANGLESPELANIHCGLAEVYWEMGRYENARLLGERALSVLEARPNDPHRGVALFLLAKTAWKQNSDEEAERLLRRAIEQLRRTLGTQHATFASVLVSLAVLMSRKNPSEADQLFAEGLQSVETRLGPNHVFTGSTLVAYAQHLAERGRKREAKNLKRRGEEILTRHSQENLLGHTFDIQAFQRSRSR
jgi:tetratricopeptide (TPR) repeat protein